MVDFLFQWLVLANFADQSHLLIACWCDNKATVMHVGNKAVSYKKQFKATQSTVVTLRMTACSQSTRSYQHASLAGDTYKNGTFCILDKHLI